MSRGGLTGQSATMMHPERWQKGRSVITVPFAERRPCLPLLPVDSLAVMGQPANSDQHDVSVDSFGSYNSYNSYNLHNSYNSYDTATLAPLNRYRMARP